MLNKLLSLVRLWGAACHVWSTRRTCWLTLEPLEDRLAPASLPAGFAESLVASGLSSATAIEIAPDGKLFVAEQGGTLEVWQNGAQVRANFFASTPLSVDSAGER